MNRFDETNVHARHRSRMKAKLERHGADIFDTYELLEMLLYHSIPYKDTNPIAKQLLATFGSLDGVLSADADKLMEVQGIGESTAKLIASVNKLKELFGTESLQDDFNVFDDYLTTGEYIRDQFKDLAHSRVMIFMLDNAMRFIDSRCVCNYDYENGAVSARDFIDPALRSRATVVITAHNHPNGPFIPTPGDRETNAMITDALRAVGLIHLDHFVISGEHFIGIMNNYRSRLSRLSAVDRFIRSKLDTISANLMSDEKTEGQDDRA